MTIYNNVYIQCKLAIILYNIYTYSICILFIYIATCTTLIAPFYTSNNRLRRLLGNDIYTDHRLCLVIVIIALLFDIYCLLQTVSFIQSNAESLPLPSEPSSPGYDNLCPNEDEQVGLEPAVGVDQERIAGTSTGEIFEMTDISDQGSKVHISGEEREWLILAWH